MKKIPSDYLAWILLLILALIWGSSFILVKRGLDVFSPGEVGALRILSASIFLLPFAIPRLKTIRKRQWIFLFIIGLCGSFIPAFLFAKAQMHMASSVAGIINALTPLFTMIMGAAFFSQRIKPKTIVGLLLGLFGTTVLILSGTEGGSISVNYYAFLVVLATIFYGINLNIIKFKLADLDSRSITSISLFIVGWMAAVYLFSDDTFLNKVRAHPEASFSLGAVIVLGVMGTALALLLFNQLVKMTSPIFASSVTYLIPFVAVVWGLLDGEKLYFGHYLAMALIVVGVYLANKK